MANPVTAASEAATKVTGQVGGLAKTAFKVAKGGLMAMGMVTLIGAGATAAIAADPSATLLSTAMPTLTHAFHGATGGLPELGQVIGNSGVALGELMQSVSGP